MKRYPEQVLPFQREDATMPMSDTHTAPSLLPYLDGRNAGLALDLDLAQVLPADISSPAADHCGPYTMTRRGRIVLDGNFAITDMLVLAQVDDYAPVGSELEPVTNLDIETSWQRAWKKIRASAPTAGAQGAAFALPCQVDDDGALIPFRPLFYCRHKKRYAHALCPFCGGALTLCRDDAVLRQNNLGSYSASLDRYLYCPACHGSGREAAFYRHSLPQDPPAGVLGCRQLIEGFSRLLTRDDLSRELPCVGCGEAAQCYGAQTLVLARMEPVHFYPFHMLMQKSPDLNAVDFIALISGAAGQEIKAALRHSGKLGRFNLLENSGAGRSDASGFLFAGDSRFFLEVLYLKLSFLEALWHLAMSDEAGPVNRMRLEGVGVKVGACGSRLPYLWNFSLQLIDPVGRPSQKSVLPAAAHAMAMEFYVRAWFYVLLVNSNQSMEQVLGGLDALQPSPSGGVDFSGAVFGPENIFRSAAPVVPDGAGQALWQEALRLGALLMGLDAVDAGSDDPSAFGQALTALKTQVRDSLFQAAPQAITVSPGIAEENPDSRIADILESMLEKWTHHPAPPQQAPVRGPSSPENHPNADGDYEETVILSTMDTIQAAPPVDFSASAAEKTVVLPVAGPDRGGRDEKTSDAISAKRPSRLMSELQKTVMQSSGGHAAPKESLLDKAVRMSGRAPDGSAGRDLEKAAATDVRVDTPPPDDFDKTVVMGHGPAAPADDGDKTVVMGHGPAPPDDDGGKTVVMGRGPEPSDDDGDKTVIMGHGPEPAPPADDLDETVLQSPAVHRAARLAGTPPVKALEEAEPVAQGADDDLDATVVLQPGSSKTRSSKNRKPGP